MLVLQIVTGIFLTMNYKPSEAEAFGSIEYIMREVEWGWLIRYMHSTGASAFFIVVYLHMFRALLYGSYKNPRELLWIIGMLIYVSLMAEGVLRLRAALGQHVVLGRAGDRVVVRRDSRHRSTELVEWIRGDYSISDITLNRFFALHVVAVPLVLILLVVVHITALHEVGSNNPDGIEIKKHKDSKGKPLDGIPFHPYYTYKDLVGVGVFLILFAIVMFFAPTFGGLFPRAARTSSRQTRSTRPSTSRPCGTSLRTTQSCAPCPTSSTGAALMGLAVLLFFFLPWLDRCKVKSIRYRGLAVTSCSWARSS